MCKKIHRGGNAEQYNADKKYKEAVAVAVEACADDTKGQTCFICTQALHWKTKEGLVRGCACRGTAGFAHVSCLAEQAKILREDAVANNKDSQWHRWYKCGLCEQEYHGAVRCALGWACWKTYLGRAETDVARCCAMQQLGLGLFDAGHHADSLSVREAELSTLRRLGVSEEGLLGAQGNLATTYQEMGRLEQAQQIFRDVFSGWLRLRGEEHRDTLLAANNYATSLGELKRFEEAKTLLRKTVPVARRVLGESHDLTLKMMMNYGGALLLDPGATLDDLREVVTTFEDAGQIARRVLGSAHPTTRALEGNLREARAALRARGTPPGDA